MRESMRNIQLRMKCRAILTYTNVVEIFEKPDMAYERACMATTKNKYYTKMLETLVGYNDRKNVPLSNENI